MRLYTSRPWQRRFRNSTETGSWIWTPPLRLRDKTATVEHFEVTHCISLLRKKDGTRGLEPRGNQQGRERWQHSIAPSSNNMTEPVARPGRAVLVTYALSGNCGNPHSTPARGNWWMCSAAPYLTAQTEACLGTSASLELSSSSRTLVAWHPPGDLIHPSYTKHGRLGRIHGPLFSRIPRADDD